MDRISYRYLVDDLLRGKSEEVKIKAKEKINKVLKVLNRGFMSEESTAMIIVQTQDELCEA